MHTQSEENYLKAICLLQGDTDTMISTNRLAEKTQTKASSVSDMLKRLAAKQLINYTKYQGVKLTKNGKEIAYNIIRKHRLWETFLVEKLHFSWNEVHEVAEELEHIKSDLLINRLDAFLGNPSHDPHGSPIPNKDGEIAKTERNVLASIKIGVPVIFSGIKDSSLEFLNYLDKNKLALGDTIEILSIENFDLSMWVKTTNKELLITKEVAHKIDTIIQ